MDVEQDADRCDEGHPKGSRPIPVPKKLQIASVSVQG
jgi:hypothetical protein